MKSVSLHRLMLFLLISITLISTQAKAAELPNVIVILSDDVGYGDLGCYGSTKIKTPNLDAMAKAGMKFMDAHAPAAVCTPTRYSLMTGQYSFRHPAGASILSGLAPLCIPKDRFTLPQLFKSKDYTTGAVGKWHLGLGDTVPDYNTEIKPGAREVGFDYSFLIPATGDRTPCVYVENGKVVNLDPKDPIRVNYMQKIGDEPTGKENPDQLTNQKPSHGHDNTIVNGISRIGWMTGGKAARWKDEDMADDLTRKAMQFIDNNKSKPFFLYFATHDAHVPRCPHPRFRGKSEHGLRGDAIVELDWCVGEILAKLKQHDLTKNTIVIFTSDNGGVMDDGYIDGTGDDKSGHQCNGVLRAKKGSPYEGGTRVPFIAQWPDKIPAGQTSNEMICHVDLMSTMASILKQKLPDNAGPDSFDLSPAFYYAKPEKPCRETLLLQSGNYNHQTLRLGSWKIVPPPPKAAKGKTELYNLDSDLGEKTDLSAKHPDKVREMTELLAKIRTATKTRP